MMSLIHQNQFASSLNLLAQDVDALVSANAASTRPCECGRGGGQRAVSEDGEAGKRPHSVPTPHGRGSYGRQPESLRLSGLPCATPSHRRQTVGEMQGMRPQIWASLILAARA
jgi:hypothetical protein